MGMCYAQFGWGIQLNKKDTQWLWDNEGSVEKAHEATGVYIEFNEHSGAVVFLKDCFYEVEEGVTDRVFVTDLKPSERKKQLEKFVKYMLLNYNLDFSKYKAGWRVRSFYS